MMSTSTRTGTQRCNASTQQSADEAARYESIVRQSVEWMSILAQWVWEDAQHLVPSAPIFVFIF